MANVHEYPVTVEWKGGRDGGGSVRADRSGVENPLSVPPEFQGPGEGTNPEEMLTSAITACYTITFGIIAANRKLPVEAVSTSAVGEVEQSGANFTYRSVVVRPRIVLSADATDEHVKVAEEMAHKADAYCIVTNAVRGKVAITIEPEVVRA
jgi:peroxiredoxin-like protein